MMRQIETWLSDSRVSNNVKYPVVYSLVDFFVMYMYFHFVQVVTPVSSASPVIIVFTTSQTMA